MQKEVKYIFYLVELKDNMDIIKDKINEEQK